MLTTSISIQEIIGLHSPLKLFREMVENAKQEKILVINTPSLRGKTCLLRFLHQFCLDNRIQSSHIDFRGGVPYPHPHYALAHEISTKIGVSLKNFDSVLGKINGFASVSQTIGVKVESEMHDLTLNDVAGGNIIKDSVVYNLSPEQDEIFKQRWFKEKICEAFLSDISTHINEKGSCVCFFDTFEDVGANEEEWLIKTLLESIRTKKLKNLIVVIAGKRLPYFENSWDWESHIVTLDKLPNMSREIIKEYGVRIGVKLSDQDIDLCFRASRGGIPFYVSLIVKNIALHEENKI